MSVFGGYLGSPGVTPGGIGNGDIGSGAVQSGQIGSGAVQGFFGTTRHIASGTVGVWDFGSGAVIAGAIGSGAVRSGNIGSGQIGTEHIADGTIIQVDIGSGAVLSGSIASGQVANFHFASGAKIDAAEWVLDDNQVTTEIISGSTPMAVGFNQSGLLQAAMASVSGRMPAIGVVVSNFLSGATAVVYRFGRHYSTIYNFSGWTNRPVYVGRSGQLSASGAPTSSGDVQQIMGVSITGSGLMLQPGDALEEAIAGSGDVGSGAIMGQGGAGVFSIGSGTIGRNDLNSGCVIDYIACEEAISGIKAVSWGSGGCFLVRAERTSGLRLPAIGVAAGQYASGAVVPVVRRGFVRSASSGDIASGFFGRFLYVGSGGHIINQSGFMGGASSGEGAAPTAAGSGYSGAIVQRLGVAISGGIDVNIGELTSGLFSGSLTQW